MEVIYAQILKLVLAVVFGGIIGLERERSHKPAGLRTHMLVCISSALITIISVDYFGNDYARLVAGIVTGIGFIGAGAIIAQGKEGMHGLTTAASLWVAAAIGIGTGIGWYVLSGVTAILTLAILFLGRLEKRLVK